jgi:para-nitrobenzyl esterase
MRRLLASLAACWGLLPSAVWADAVMATIDSGLVVGVGNDQVAAFKGMPYATAPVGALRWRPPGPVQPWVGERQAVDYGASCAQAGIPAFTPRTSQGAVTSEDCLFLNVWAPAKATGVPVVVWIHGGGNTGGTSAQTFYDGSAFARDGVILVSLNYRLGLFGFFAHPALQSADANFGLLDQIAALAWVQRNIRAFGGDPGRVTVMGESAGGQDILALLTAPAARGLFARAIIESPGGGWERYPTLSQARSQGESLARKLGATTAEELRKLSVDSLVQAGASQEIGPILDGTALTETPLRAVLASHVTAATPILIGSNSGEGSLLPSDITLANGEIQFTPAEVTALQGLYGPVDDHALARAVFRDGLFAGPVRFIAGHWPASAYVYRFDYVAAVMRLRRSDAWHGSEVPYVFDTANFANAEDDRKVVNLIHTCWVNFIKEAVPKCPGMPDWPAYRSTDDHLMRVTDAPALVPNPAAAPLALLASKLPTNGK